MGFFPFFHPSIAHDATQDPETPDQRLGKIVYGVASYYSKSLEGSETSTGETFHHENMTGASNFFPLNTYVRVTNLSNNISVIVRINDRMHQRMADRGRVLDVTIRAARTLDFMRRGICRVKVEAVPKGTLK